MGEDRLRVMNAIKTFFDIYTHRWITAHVDIIYSMRTAYRRPTTVLPSAQV